MKRYLLFSGSDYYASGGMWDFIEDSDDIESLIEKSKYLMCHANYDWYHIFDTIERRITHATKFQAHGAPDFEWDDDWRQAQHGHILTKPVIIHEEMS